MNNTFILENITLIDPVNKISEKRTLYIQDGKYIDNIKDASVQKVNCEGLFAAPGFIDIHTHVFEGGSPIAINPDKIGVFQGVLSVVDAGSSGIKDFEKFNDEIIKKSETDIYFFLNVSKNGLCEGLNELSDMSNLMSEEEFFNFQKVHGKKMVGIKVRMSSSVLGKNGIKPLVYAKALAKRADIPLMVHIGNAPPTLGEVLSVLEKGDIVTHCFHGKKGGVPYFPHEFSCAKKRGVLFDVGHGSASFSYNTVNKVLDIQPIDYTISTDLYEANFEAPVGSLMNTMSKFIPLGVSIEELVRKVTLLPRQYLNLHSESFSAGEYANITIFKIIEENKSLMDSMGFQFQTKKCFKPYASIKKGRTVWSDELFV